MAEDMEKLYQERFIEAIKDSEVQVLGISCLLTISFDAIARTVKAMEQSGIRDKLSIMMGGAPITELVKEKTDCDFYGKDAISGLRYVNKIYS